MTGRMEKLRGALAEFEAELRDIESLDAPTRASLEKVAAEIAAVLRHGAADSPPQSLSALLSGQAADFEVSHPTLAGVLERLIDSLSQMGI